MVRRIAAVLCAVLLAGLVSGCTLAQSDSMPTPSITPSVVTTSAPQGLPTDLEPDRRAALETYLAQHSEVTSAFVRASFMSLAERWGSADMSEPRVKQQLVDIARKDGYALSDCLWFQFVASDGPVSELLGYDAKARVWRLLAVRKGSTAAPLVETP